MSMRLIEVMKNSKGINGDNPLYADNMILKTADYDWLIEQVSKSIEAEESNKCFREGSE